MPFAPATQYRGDAYLFQGISKLGDVFSDELREYMKLKKEGNMNDTIIQHAVSTGRITPEEYNTYIQGNWTKKQGIAAGIMADMHDDWQRSMFQQEQEQKQAALANAMQIAQLHTGSAEAIARMNIDAGKYASGGANEPIATDPLIDPTSKQPVPGYGIVRKTGAVVPTSTEVPDVILDPTKNFIWKGPKLQWQPLQSKLARRLDNTTTGDMPAPAAGGLRGMLPSWLGGTPAPTATPAPAIPPPDIPAAQGVTPGPAYPTVDAAAARSQAKAKIDAGADRDAVIARLKQLGVDSSGL